MISLHLFFLCLFCLTKCSDIRGHTLYGRQFRARAPENRISSSRIETLAALQLSEPFSRTPSRRQPPLSSLFPSNPTTRLVPDPNFSLKRDSSITSRDVSLAPKTAFDEAENAVSSRANFKLVDDEDFDDECPESPDISSFSENINDYDERDPSIILHNSRKNDKKLPDSLDLLLRLNRK